MKETIPPFRVTDGELAVRLPAWDAHSYGKRKEEPHTVLVSVGGDAMLFDDSLLTPTEHRAYEAIFSNADRMREVLLSAIAATDGAKKAGVTIASLPTQLQLQSITIHRVAKGGLAIVGYSFSCAWEEEHGVGVLTHGEEVAAIGGADTAILSWMARDAAGVKKAGTTKRKAKAKKR